MIDHKWNLQLFADGGGDGGAAPGSNGGSPGGETSTPAAPAASGVQEPPLRPAQERQMRRSGQLKKSSAAAPASTPAAPAAESAEKGQAEGAPAGEQPDKEASQGDHSEYLKFLSDHPQETTQLLREMTDRISANMAKSDQRYMPIMKALAEKYGTDPDDVDGIMEALKGPVKDDAYYNALAMQMGTSVENAKKMDELQTQNQRLQRAQQRSAQLAQQQRQAEQVRQIQANWARQAESLKAKYPDFDFARERQNPDFTAILRSGGSMELAYRATHFDQLANQIQANTAQQVEQGVLNRVEQRAARPAENGISPAHAGSALKMDPRTLTKAQCEELERRAARGDKITFR